MTELKWDPFGLPKGWTWLKPAQTKRGPLFRARNNVDTTIIITGASPGSVIWKVRHNRPEVSNANV